MGDEEQGSAAAAAAPAAVEQPSQAASVVEKPPRKKPGPKPKAAPVVEAAVAPAVVVNVAPPAPVIAPTPPPEAIVMPALLAAMRDVEAVGKDERNEHHRFSYASSEEVIAEGRRALLAHGLMLVAEPQTFSEVGTNPPIPTLFRSFRLYHTSGASIPVAGTPWPVCEGKGRPMDKAMASADTTQLAYTYRTLLSIKRGDSDDDMNAPTRRDHDREYDDQRDRPRQQAAPMQPKPPTDGLDRMTREALFDRLEIKPGDRVRWMSNLNGYDVPPRSFSQPEMDKVKAGLIRLIREKGAANNGVGTGPDDLPG